MSNETSVVISASGVWKAYNAEQVTVLRGVSLEICAGERVALWGSSGSGKSTLLHLLGGLDRPDRGEIRVCGLDPVDENRRLELRRRHVGFVFQLHNLIPDLTLEENIQIPMLAVNWSAAEIRTRIDHLVGVLGIENRRGHRIQDLSGGERQRVAIARALACRPSVILADEPTGSLDEVTGEHVFELLGQVARQDRIAVVLATHERRFAEACDRRLRLRGGQLVPE